MHNDRAQKNRWVVQGLGIKRGISFLLFKIDDRRACAYADGDDLVKWKIDDRRERVYLKEQGLGKMKQMCLRKYVIV